MTRLKKRLLFAAAAIGTFALDWASKAWITGYLPPNGQKAIIPGFFDLVNIRNRGAAFGFLNNPDTEWQFWLFMAATAIAVIAILAMLRETNKSAQVLGLGLILGGAAGNLVDRIRFRAVIDFLDFYWGGWHWPAFNIADSGICVGAFLLCVSILRKPVKP